MVAREAVLAKAREWVGMMERTGNNDIWFAEDWGIGGSAWCFAFVQSCFYYAEPTPSGKLPYLSMYCPAGIQWARDNGQSIEVEQAHLVQPGDIVFFSWDMNAWGRWTPGTGDHVGIVESYGGGDAVNTIEGNIGSPQGVYRKVRSISGTVVNFWRPSVFSGGPLTISQEDDMFESEDRATNQQALAAAQSVLTAVGTLDALLRDTFNNLIWTRSGIDELKPAIQETHVSTSQTWEKLKDVDFTAPPAAADTPAGAPPADDQSDRLESLERRFAVIEQAIARLAGPRPPVASPTAPAAAPT